MFDAARVSRRVSEWAPLFLAAAAIAMGYVLQWTHGHYDPEAIYVVIGAWVFTVIALFVRRGVAGRWLELLLLIGLMCQLYLLAVNPPTIEMHALRDPVQLHDFFMGLSVVGVLAGTSIAGAQSPLAKLWFPAVVAVHFLMGALILKLAPTPHIDVFTVEVDSLKALLSGTNPYAITFPNPYGDHSPYFPPGVSVNGRLQFGFVYPPLALLLCMPGYLLGGDPRFSILAAMGLSALLIGYARPGQLGKLAATLFLFTPPTFFVLDRAWTDPFVVLVTAGVAFTALRAPKYLFVAIGLFACLKQQMVIATPALLLLMPRPLRWREIAVLAAKSMAVGLAITLPFFLWSPKAFANSVLNLREMYRLDCLSVLSHLANQNVVQLSKWSGLIAIVPVIAAGLWKAPRSVFGFASLAAATHFTVYIFSTHGFCNEYYNVVGGLWLAVGVWRAGTVERQACDAEQTAVEHLASRG